MIERLKSRRARRLFAVLCGVLVLLAAILNYYVNRSLKPRCEEQQIASTALGPNAYENRSGSIPCSPAYQFIIDTVPDISISFMSAVLTALFFLAMIALVKDDEEAVHDIETLGRDDQRKKHKEALSQTRNWHHDGHLASWVSRKVLPEFQRQCCDHNAYCEIKVAIMDPTHNGVCETYLSHIRGLAKEDRRYPDLSSVKTELCASIYVLTRGYSPGHLNVEIYLKDRIDFLRDDISDGRAFWTTVGSDVPAISLFNRNNKSPFYNLVKKNFAVNIKEYKQLDVPGAAVKAMDTVLRPEAVKAVLAHYFPNHQSSLCSDDSVDRIIKRLQVH
jgi:hypothetical protein